MDFVIDVPLLMDEAKPYVPMEFLGIPRNNIISDRSKNNDFEIVTAPWL